VCCFKEHEAMAGKRSFKTDHADPVVQSLERSRERVGFSQKQMADALGVPFRTYQKWIYAKQKPRHAAALVARAEQMCAPRRTNCWDVLQCGRGPGGEEAIRQGLCPAAGDSAANGVNAGINGGRVCWAISGTFCGLESEGSAAKKFISCMSCDFFYQVLEEEGLSSFKLLKPGQTYTQT
jgi:hypothetical protein